MSIENIPTEPSFEEQVHLAKELSDAVDARNDFIERMGGFDDFAAVHQHVDGNREAYDELEKSVNTTRKNLDESISDKRGLVEYLRNIHEDALADRIARMFEVK